MISFKSNRAGTLSAVQIGACRIGYVMESKPGRWTWQLSFLKPDGGGYRGIEPDEASAKAAAEGAFAHWAEAAGLQDMNR